MFDMHRMNWDITKAVNNLVENSFIPNMENAEVKALFMKGLTIFKAHEKHAEQMVASLK